MKIIRTLLLALVATTAGYGQSFLSGTNPQPAVIQEDAFGPFVVGGTISATLQHGWNPGPGVVLHVTLVGTKARFFGKGQTAEAQRSDGLGLPIAPFDDRLDISIPMYYGMHAWLPGSTITIKNISIDCLDSRGAVALKDGDTVFVQLSMSGGDLTFSGAHLALLRVVSTMGRR